MRIFLLAFTLIFAHGAQYAPAEETAKTSSREKLRQSAFYFTYPGGMLFHTTFHEAITTRYLLLKTALASPGFEKYLELDANQREHIQKLRPLRYNFAKPLAGADGNAQPDEQLIDPDYYSFLRADQLDRLDLVALQFDGYAALTRQSLAWRVGLSDCTKKQINETVASLRDRIFLPRFRWEFAAPLPDDIKFRDCQFAGAFVAQTNLLIVDHLTDEECERIVDLAVKKIDHSVIRELKDIATLPGGVQSLLKNLIEEEVFGVPPKSRGKQRSSSE